MAKCSKYHAKCKVTMPKCSKYHAKWQILVPNCCCCKYKADGTRKESQKKVQTTAICTLCLLVNSQVFGRPNRQGFWWLPIIGLVEFHSEHFDKIAYQTFSWFFRNMIIPEELAKKVRSELSSNVAEDASILSGGFSFFGFSGKSSGNHGINPLVICYSLLLKMDDL